MLDYNNLTEQEKDYIVDKLKLSIQDGIEDQANLIRDLQDDTEEYSDHHSDVDEDTYYLSELHKFLDEIKFLAGLYTKVISYEEERAFSNGRCWGMAEDELDKILNDSEGEEDAEEQE